MSKLMNFILIGAAAAFARVCQASTVPEDWYVADLVRVSGKPMVCPPGVEAVGVLASRRTCGSHDAVSPEAYLAARCPGAALVAIQPVFVPSHGLDPIRLVMGFTSPASGVCPPQGGAL